MDQIILLAGGLMLGCFHALEADHIVTVSLLILDKGSLSNSLKLAVQWGLGHSLTLFILAGFMMSLDSAATAFLGGSAEQMVGAAMIFLGIVVFYQELKRSSEIKNTRHNHTGLKGSVLFGMGVLHGTAGSASIFLLIPVTLTQSVGTVFAYVGLFSIGMVLTMGLYGLFLQKYSLSNILSRYLTKIRYGVAILSVTIGIRLLGI
ncbi:MAG: hypothetical protein HOL15_07130 [Nitrospinaceae bacterium]|nr:hypothetical protein [Nitrospina sp.]MBT5376570.1 hypothetical protein [Nitrospinaceae bacterium]MBT5868496.1 hypothetical protein [Nitrospinaceae bacterium]MBT6346257.1 hypothetical protein [Nitrospina sp.]